MQTTTLFSRLQLLLRLVPPIAFTTMAASGCDSLLLSSPKPVREGSYLVHVVSPAGGGEDIDTILIWYTGTENTRSVVEDANKGVGLKQLRPGQHILIPRSVVTQMNPLPRKKFSFSRESERGAGPSTSEQPAPLKGAQNVDPLEDLLSKQESKQGKKVPAAAPQKKDVPTRETFDIEDEASAASNSSSQSHIGGGEVGSVDLDAVLKQEQAEVDKLRQEVAPIQEVPSFDPDEHLP